MVGDTLTAPTEEATKRPHEVTINSDSLVGSMFGVEVEKKEETQTQATEQQQASSTSTEVAKPDEQQQQQAQPDPWHKTFGWESEDVAKNEITELRKLKEAKPQEVKFENEQSKKIYDLLAGGKVEEVIDFYSKQKEIDKVLTADVNKMTASEIIKLNLQLKYPSLTKDQIDFQYRQEYGVPKEPIYNESKETEEEFKERHDAWKEQVSNVEMKATIAATMAKPELEQQKAKIVLPDISQPQVQQKQLTQEELDAAKRYNEDYLRSVDLSTKDFSGFSVKVKNEAVGLPETTISYGVIDSEKMSLAESMKDFSKAGYDANTLFVQRWLKEDGTLNTKQMIEDRYLLDNRDKIIQKIADDSAQKAIDAYMKAKKNVNVTDTNQTQVTQLTEATKTPEDNLRDLIYG